MAMSRISFSKFIGPLFRFASNPPVRSCKRHVKCRGLKQFSTESKSRPKPATMKLESPEFKAIFTPEVTQLVSLFDKYGYELRVVGGAVRDLLMGKKPHDLDFATTATPSEMKEMFTKEEIRMINMNGESHGTITPRINTENFEITTLRIDVRTDGRRASVEFTKDWYLDALRRDLTINSMFLGFDGTIYDYFHGYEDLLQRKLVFVGNAEDRIIEDYLRILRYFRFYGRIADSPDKHEETVLKAIESNIEGLSKISGERIWNELQMILTGNFRFELLEKMIDCGICPYIGLPDNPNVQHLREVQERTEGITDLRPITILSSLLRSANEVVNLNTRLKMPSFDRDLAFFIVEHREEKLCPKALLPFQKLVLRSIKGSSVAQKWCIEVLLYQGHKDLATELKNWKVPKFPVSGHDLTNAVPAKKFKEVIADLKDYWADSDFQCSKEEILAQLPSTLEKLGLSPVHSSSEFK